MVDCRAAGVAGASGAPGPAPHDLPHAPPPPPHAGSAPNGGHSAPPPENQHNQAGASGDMGAHGVTSPGAGRASTPSGSIATYPGGMTMPAGVAGMPGAPYMGVGPCAPYMCGVKSVVWCAPHSPPPHAQHAPPPPPPPPPVNPHVYKSVQANGADLPMNDIPTLRYYFNLGVECMWAAYGPPPPPQHPPHAPPPRHYSPRDIAQDMQQMSIHERQNAGMNHVSGDNHNKHKPAMTGDKPLNNQGKGNGQRPLLGPRFKRGNNQEGNQNNHSHKGHNNNNMPNKGPNNRRNSHTEAAPRGPPPSYGSPGEAECVMEQPLLTLPYIPYPPPLYPISYYPVETDPAMMGMMGGMGYVGYDEGVEYGAPLPYYPPPFPPPAPHLPPPANTVHHHDHK